MAHMTWEPTYSLPAAIDFRSLGPVAAVINGSGLIALPTIGALPECVIDGPFNTGEMARFFIVQRYVGRIRVGTGGIAAYAKFCANASGHAVVGASTHKYFGKALQAGVAGDYITALFDFSGAYGAVA